MRIKILVGLFVSLSSNLLGQFGGLPEWPHVLASPQYIKGIDNLPGTNIIDFTPHITVDWRQGVNPSIAEIPGTAPSSGQDNVAPAQVGFNDCGEMNFYVLHSGDLGQINALEIYSPDGVKLLGTNTFPPAPNGNGYDLETQIVKRPGVSNQWFLIYTEQHSDPYMCQKTLYSLITIKGKKADYVTLNGVLQKDIPLTAPPVNTSPGSPFAARLYAAGKAVSRTSKTAGTQGHDLYMHRRFEGGPPARPTNSSFSIDRFEITNSGIQWTANSGSIPSYGWTLLAPSSPIELSPTENRLAVMATTDVIDREEFYIFDLTVPGGIGNSPTAYEAVKINELLVVPDMTNAAVTGYSASLGNLSTYQTVEQLGTSLGYLRFLKNYDRKISKCEFSWDGNSLYTVAGGYVQSGYGNLTYLSQIDLNASFNGRHPVRIQVQAINDWQQNDGRSPHYWGNYKNDESVQQHLLDFEHTISLQSCINGNLYFTKHNRSHLFVIPDPNSPMPVHLVPYDIDLSTSAHPNVAIQGLVSYTPDQIDGYNYTSSDYTKVTGIVGYQAAELCSLRCKNLAYQVIEDDSLIIYEDTIVSCLDTFEICISTLKSYKIVGQNGKEFDQAIVNGTINMPANSAYFNFTTDSVDSTQCCPALQLWPDSLILCEQDLPFTLETQLDKNHSFLWSDGSRDSLLQITGAGLYFVEVSIGSCIRRDSIWVLSSNLGPLSLADTNVHCEKSALSLDTKLDTSGLRFLWDDGSTEPRKLFSNLTIRDAKTYTLTITDSYNCPHQVSINLTVKPVPNFFPLNDTSICAGESMLLYNPFGHLVSVNGGPYEQEYATNSSVGTSSYFLSYLDPNSGCAASDTFILTVYPIPEITLADSLIFCEDDSILIDCHCEQTGNNIIWSNGSNQAQIFAHESGLYQVVATNPISLCSATDSVLIRKVDQSEFSIEERNTFCEGDSLKIGTNFPQYANYRWNTGETSPSIVIHKTGLYSLQITAYNCSWIVSTTIFSTPIPISDMTQDTSLCLAEKPEGIRIGPASETGTDYLWSTGERTREILISKEGWYSVIITDELGCSISDSILVNNKCLSNLWLPTAFSPNGDGTNDLFHVVPLNVSSFTIDILDRWGLKIWTGDEGNPSWDGTYNGKLVQNDVYVWIMIYKAFDEKGQEKNHQQIGTVTVVR